MLDVSGSLHLTVDDEDVAFSAAGTQLTVDVARPRRVLRGMGSLLRTRAFFAIAGSRLDAVGLTLSIRKNGRTLARLGYDVKTSAIGRLLRIPHLVVYLRKPPR